MPFTPITLHPQYSSGGSTHGVITTTSSPNSAKFSIKRKNRFFIPLTCVNGDGSTKIATFLFVDAAGSFKIDASFARMRFLRIVIACNGWFKSPPFPPPPATTQKTRPLCRLLLEAVNVVFAPVCARKGVKKAALTSCCSSFRSYLNVPFVVTLRASSSRFQASPTDVFLLLALLEETEVCEDE